MLRIAAGLLAVLSLGCPPAADAQTATPPKVDADGTVYGDVGPVPISGFLSPQARDQLTLMLQGAGAMPSDGGIDEVRARSDERSREVLARWRDVAAVEIKPEILNGVPVHVVTPATTIPAANADRVLINAHGGGFFVGAAYGGQIEAVPMADAGKVKVIAVDYRMAPEHVYPAASEDMEAVYRHVLKTTSPEKVGFYGCSAGGALVGQMIPWLRSKNLPLPGAIGVFCSGLMPSFWYGGDAAAVSGLLNARTPMRSAPTPRWRPYFDGIDVNDPMITPALFPETLAAYPPTLTVTGTRDVAMSNALMTHTRLLSAGVVAELFVQEGLGHGHFNLMPGTPEAATAHQIMWRFFDRHLAR
jgi:monoterpene epsilon-lactone hydrolase